MQETRNTTKGTSIDGLVRTAGLQVYHGEFVRHEGHRGAVGPSTFTHGRSPILSTRMQMNAGGLDRAGHEAGSDFRPSLRWSSNFRCGPKLWPSWASCAGTWRYRSASMLPTLLLPDKDSRLPAYRRLWWSPALPERVGVNLFGDRTADHPRTSADPSREGFPVSPCPIAREVRLGRVFATPGTDISCCAQGQ
jgi:hypothetical protein